MPARMRVLVLGGGFAGLESTFLLRHRLHDDVDLTLVSDATSFLFRPNTIYIPFGADPESLRIPLEEPCRRRGVRLVHGRVAEVDPVARAVSLSDGTRLGYDRLVVATGSAMRPEEVPGLAEHGAAIWTPADMLRLRETVERVVARGRAGTPTRVLFLVPPNNKCAGPLYELVFMLETHLRRNDARDPVEITWATFEAGYIQAFGPKLHEVVTRQFAERGITGHTGRRVVRVEPGEAEFADGGRCGFDEMVSFPPYIAAVDHAALPRDDRGFVTADPATRRVAGLDDVYVPGDAGDFPVKQAFLAFLQADAVAETLAAEVTGGAPRATFDPVSMCVMEQFDTATFAQVPLRVTGDPERPVEVRPGAEDDYKVGVSPVWRLGKKMLGVYLPMRFHAGEPFHAGAAWTLMDVGLRGMSGVLAR